MDMNQYRKHLAKSSKKSLTEARRQYDGKVNQVVWHSQRTGAATVQVNTKHDRGEFGLDEATFKILKAHIGPRLHALTQFKVDPNPIRSAENYYLIHVEFICYS